LFAIVKFAVAIWAYGNDITGSVRPLLSKFADVMSFKIWKAVCAQERGLLITALANTLCLFQHPSFHRWVTLILRY